MGGGLRVTLGGQGARNGQEQPQLEMFHDSHSLLAVQLAVVGRTEKAHSIGIAVVFVMRFADLVTAIDFAGAPSDLPSFD
jgi:hypothetical protein